MSLLVQMLECDILSVKVTLPAPLGEGLVCFQRAHPLSGGGAEIRSAVKQVRGSKPVDLGNGPKIRNKASRTCAYSGLFISRRLVCRPKAEPAPHTL